MRVQVRRVSGMPHNVQLFIDDRPEAFILYIDAGLIDEQTADLLAMALNTSVRYWSRNPADEGRPELRLHTG